MRHKPVDQQVIVITGASSGIGLCTALVAAERGASVVLAARSIATLDAVASDIQAHGGRAVAVECDVADRAQVDALAARAVEAFGRIDTWVNNAGASIYGRIEEVSEADSRRLFETNFWGVVNGSLAALPHLRAHGGALVNVGSEVSEAVVPTLGMYAASKHAVKGFTDALRLEVEHRDDAPVTVTLIQPTAVDTPFPLHARNYMDAEPQVPAPRLDPHQVAEAILDAATGGGRDVKVGAMARVNTAMARFLPGLADRLAAMQESRFRKDRPAGDTQGALHVAGESGQVYGRGGD